MWRTTRGAVVGACATGLALGAHVSADGGAPSTTVVAATTVVLGTTSVALSRFRWTFPRLLVLLLGAQVGLHHVFAAAEPLHHAQHGLHASSAHGAAQVAATAAGGGAMTASHVLAAVLTALLLRRGEAWLCAVVDTLALRLVPLWQGRLTVPALSLPPVLHPRLVPCPDVPARAWSPRGPPAE